MRELAVLVIVLLGAVLACGCTAQTSPQAAQQTTRAAMTQPVLTQAVVTQPVTPASSGLAYTVHVTATSFDRWDLEINKGDTVIWVNEDKMIRHIVHLPTEATGKELFNSGPLSPGDTYSYTFYTPGRYVYGDPQHGGGRSPYVNVS